MTFSTKTLSLAAILAASVSGAALAQSASTDGSMSATGSTAGAQTSTELGASTDAATGLDTGTDVTASTDSNATMGDTDVPMNTAEGSMSSEMSSETHGNSANAHAAKDMRASAEGDWNYGKVVSSIQTGENLDADIAAIDDASEVKVKGVSELQGEAEGNAQGLDNALASADADLTEMRGLIGENADLTAALEDGGYSADEVIGIYETADGSFEVIVDDRM